MIFRSGNSTLTRVRDLSGLRRLSPQTISSQRRMILSASRQPNGRQSSSSPLITPPSQSLSLIRAPIAQETRRSFLTSFLPIPSSPFSSPSSTTSLQTVTVTSVLPHRVSNLFELIANISEYHNFVPYCARSSVSKWSGPDPVLGRRWPARAKLVVGWGGIEEEYISRVYCSPAGVGSAPVAGSDSLASGSGREEWIVEAVAGKGDTSLAPELISHYFKDGREVLFPEPESRAVETNGDIDSTVTTTVTTSTGNDPARSSTTTMSSSRRTTTVNPVPPKPSSFAPGSVFSHMVTRWSLMEQSSNQTKVSLTIKFAFSNPLYTLMSGPVLPKMSESMMGAFRRHASESLSR